MNPFDLNQGAPIYLKLQGQIDEIRGSLENRVKELQSLINANKIGLMRVDAKGRVAFWDANGIFKSSPYMLFDGSQFTLIGKLFIANDSGVANGEHFIGYFSRDVGETTADLLLGYRADGAAVTANLIRSGNSLALVLGTSSVPQAIVLEDSGTVTILDIAGTNSAGVNTDANGKLSRGSPLAYRKVASTTIANSTTETSVLDAGVNSNAIAANLAAVGTMIDFEFWGYYSTIMTPTLRLRFKIGSTTILDSGLITTGLSVANNQVRIRGNVTFWSIGAMATVSAQGEVYMGGIASPITPIVTTGTSSIDSTTAQAMSVTAQWGTALAQDSVTITNGWIRIS